ncbi:MAG: hypothetical protein QOC81_187 [Thermoanaerobaculia bacterium]|nr:hypothetical protein [Thermoanaerobaculia bacterium]
MVSWSCGLAVLRDHATTRPRNLATAWYVSAVTAEAPPETYFLEIEAHFALRRGTPFILNTKDWALMKKWYEDGVPLPVVIEAIDTVFERNESSGRKKVISSLHYCRHSIKELWNERRNLYVGAGDMTPESGPEVLLDALAVQLEASEIAAPFAARLRALASEKSVPKIEERLIDLERELIDAFIATFPTEIDSIRAEIALALGDPSKLDAKTRARTEEANLRRLVREKFGLPRLTLF